MATGSEREYEQVGESRLPTKTERHTCAMSVSDDYIRPGGAYVRPPLPYQLSRNQDLRRDGFPVSGVFYRQESIKKLPIGADLVAELIPEPANPYDFNAVCVKVEESRSAIYREDWQSSGTMSSLTSTSKDFSCKRFLGLKSRRKTTSNMACYSTYLHSSNGMSCMQPWALTPNFMRFAMRCSRNCGVDC
jgi:hypothetical protein